MNELACWFVRSTKERRDRAWRIQNLWWYRAVLKAKWGDLIQNGYL